MATKAASRAVTTAMAIAGRASRACDVCAGKGARWYCGADAAYLCDRCDTQVHSANALSLRHERVRLTPNCTPARKPSTDCHPGSSPPPRKRSMSKILHSPAPHVLPSRKRCRTIRPHPHHRLRPLMPQPEPKQSSPIQSNVKIEVKAAEELHQQQLTFDDLFDTEDFFTVDDTQEVPSLITASPSPSSEPDSSFENSFDSSFDAFSPDFHAVSSPSDDSNFAVYFKGKAAHDDDVMSDHFLVPDVGLRDEFEKGFDAGIDPVACDVNGGIHLAGEACFIPGDIPDLAGFEDFGSRELGSLSFELELREASSPDHGDAGTGRESSARNAVEAGRSETDRFANGPFAKFFASRPKPESVTVSNPETFKSEAKEILRCCREGLSEEDLRAVPSLRLNYDDVITAWSGRGEPWVNPDGFVPKLIPDGDGDGDDDQSSGGREARVLRYKEKRRSRLFSKTIRYEVRKLNAERRPRQKGRFVKRTGSS